MLSETRLTQQCLMSSKAFIIYFQKKPNYRQKCSFPIKRAGCHFEQKERESLAGCVQASVPSPNKFCRTLQNSNLWRKIYIFIALEVWNEGKLLTSDEFISLIISFRPPLSTVTLHLNNFFALCSSFVINKRARRKKT